jgi:hypothetical protein
MHRLVGLSAFLLLSLIVSSCGDDSSDDDGVDTTPDEDAGNEPIDEFDGSVPPPVMRDSGTVIDGAPPDGIEGNCAVDSNKVFHLAVSDEAPSLSALSVDRIESRFGLAYIDPSLDCLDAIYLAELKGAPGTVPEPDKVELIDHCSTLDDVAIAHNETNWLVATVDSWMGAADVWVHNADPEAIATLPSHRITDDPDLLESKLSITTWGDAGAMVGWVQTSFDGSVSQLMVRALDAEGAPVADAVELDRIDAGTSPAAFNSVTVRAVGNDNVLVAYHKLESMGGGKSSVLMHTVDRSGTPLREAMLLTDVAPEDAGVDVAAGVGDQISMGSDGSEVRTERGGAIVWTEQVAETGLQIWFQAVGPDGEPARLLTTAGGAAPKRRLVNSPLRAIDPSVARMPTGVGFAVAYRALVGGPVNAPRIRLLFLDRTGAQIGDSDIAYTSDWGGRTAIQSSLDGRFTIGWNELDENDQTVTTLIQVPCTG